jgi:hypothetical protein
MSTDLYVHPMQTRVRCKLRNPCWAFQGHPGDSFTLHENVEYEPAATSRNNNGMHGVKPHAYVRCLGFGYVVVTLIF